MNPFELIYDWNTALPLGLVPTGPVQLNDETLRDGLQSPSVRDPSFEEKIQILHLMEALELIRSIWASPAPDRARLNM